MQASSFDDVVNHLNDPGIDKAAFGADSDAFLQQTAGVYFNVSCSAIRAHDTNHMILGVRNAYLPVPVINAMRGFVDLVDQHGYGDLPPSNLE